MRRVVGSTLRHSRPLVSTVCWRPFRPYCAPPSRNDSDKSQQEDVNLTQTPPAADSDPLVEKVEKVKLDPPPHQEEEENKLNPREWMWPLAIGAVGGLAATFLYYTMPQRPTQSEEPRPVDPVIEPPRDRPPVGEEQFIEQPPAHPMIVADSFPSLTEETKELERTFCYAGTFVIAMGPREFNRYDLINDYLADNRHAIKFHVHPQAYSSPLMQYRAPHQPNSAIRDLIAHSLHNTIDFGLVPMLEHVGGDVFEQMTELIEQRGPSSDQFIWINEFDVILDYVDAITDPQEKAREQADLRCLLLWLVEMSIYRNWCQVLIQSTDPFLLTRLEPYLPVRTDPQVRKISFGERSGDAMERRLKRLLEMNHVHMAPESITALTKNVGGSAPLLEHAVKLLLGGKQVQDIIEIQLQPAIVGLERLLLEGPHRLILWELMQILVDNYEKTGLLFVPDRLVSYSTSAREVMKEAWAEFGDYLYFYEIPTGHMMEQQANTDDGLPRIQAGYISTTSVRAMTSCIRLVRDPDMQKVMWNEKKRSTTPPISFHT